MEASNDSDQNAAATSFVNCIRREAMASMETFYSSWLHNVSSNEPGDTGAKSNNNFGFLCPSDIIAKSISALKKSCLGRKVDLQLATKLFSFIGNLLKSFVRRQIKVANFEVLKKPLADLLITVCSVVKTICLSVSSSQSTHSTHDCAEIILSGLSIIETTSVAIATITREEGTSCALMEYVFKKCLSHMTLVCILCRQLNHNKDINAVKKKALDVLEVIYKAARCNTLDELLCGKSNGAEIETNPYVDRHGLFEHLLRLFMLDINAGNDAINFSIIRAFVFCLTKVIYPSLSPCISGILPLILILLDYHDVTVRGLGISCVRHLVMNVTPSALKLYNHADVLYDALFKQLYGDNPLLCEVSYECMIHLLAVYDPNPASFDNVTFTKWDNVLQQLLVTMTMTSKSSSRRHLAACLTMYIEKMGVASLKQLHDIMSAITSYLQYYDGDGEKTRIAMLQAMQHLLRTCWIRVDSFFKPLLGSLLKFSVDAFSTTSTIEIKVKGTLRRHAVTVFVLLRNCCGENMDKILRSLLQVETHKSYEPLKDMFNEILLADVSLESNDV